MPTQLVNLQKDSSQILERAEESDKIRQFLDTVKMIESSGGQNFDHQRIPSGIHEGHRAIGNYGLMPNTVDEVINRMKLKGDDVTNLSQYRKLSPEELKAKLEAAPDDENRLAEFLANKVLKQYGGDEEKAAYSWMYGHNLPADRIEKRKYQEDDYVKKYNKYKNMFKNNKLAGM